MIPWTLLDTAPLPQGGGELRLWQRGSEFSIRVGATSATGAAELMNSRQSGSEEALARLACSRLSGRARPRVLVGGLGMGFTLRAALALLGPDARVVVAELVPAVIAWAQGPLRGVMAGALGDPRVEVRAGDVGALIGGRERWDAILLDVDNGPEALTVAGNDALYGHAGLADARQALGPAGVLAVWSAAPDPGFRRRLSDAGFACEEHVVRARGRGGGARHTIWLASRPAAGQFRASSSRRAGAAASSPVRGGGGGRR